MKGDALDPKGLIQESYRIDGISEPECRSIFVDWALSRPQDGTDKAVLEALLARFADQPQDHPMTIVIREGLSRPERTGRRGGRAARVANRPD